VLTSAFPSMGIDYPASCLGVRGSSGVFDTPFRKVHCCIQIAVKLVPIFADELSLFERKFAVYQPALRAPSARGEPSIRPDYSSAAPSLLVAHEPRELRPTSIGDGAGKARVSHHASHVQVFDHEAVVGFD
jgi:hypothetical protein